MRVSKNTAARTASHPFDGETAQCRTELGTVGGIATENNPYSANDSLLSTTPTKQGYGLTTLFTEHPAPSDKVNALYQAHAPAAGRLPQASLRNLDQLTINPGHAPD